MGGLPLGLTLIAGALVEDAGQPRWVRKAIERLRETEARLALSGEDREGTLGAIVEMSVTGLPPDVQEAFAMLGAFAAKPADFGREAALAVWEVDGEEKGDGWLRRLVDRGLLETAGIDRFAVHPVLGDLARGRMGEEDGVRGGGMRSIIWALAWGDRENWQRIEAELEQIRWGWEWVSGDSGDDEGVLAFWYALRVLFGRRGFWKDLLSWTARALEGGPSPETIAG